MLSAADLAYMQSTQNTAMPGTVVIQRATLVNDGGGNMYETWAGAGTVTGRIMQQEVRSTGETLGGGQVHSHTQWWATLPWGTDVVASDRLVYSGRSWEVLSVNNDESWGTATRCELLAHGEELRT